MSEPIQMDLETMTGMIHVGRAFVEARRGIVTTNLTYDGSYLSLPVSFAIDPEFPITRGTMP